MIKVTIEGILCAVQHLDVVVNVWINSFVCMNLTLGDVCRTGWLEASDKDKQQHFVHRIQSESFLWTNIRVQQWQHHPTTAGQQTSSNRTGLYINATWYIRFEMKLRFKTELKRLNFSSVQIMKNEGLKVGTRPPICAPQSVKTQRGWLSAQGNSRTVNHQPQIDLGNNHD